MVKIIVIVLLLILLIVLINAYNKLVALLNRAHNAFSQIDVQLKRRYDLIPNLVEIARKYMQHEEDTLRKVVESRNEAKKILDLISNDFSDANIKALNKAEGMLENALSGLNIAVEAYPELKASENMKQLSEEITSSENKIAFARQAYNDSVTNFNTYKESFPANFIVTMFSRFRVSLRLLEFDEGIDLNIAPKVRF